MKKLPTLIVLLIVTLGLISIIAYAYQSSQKRAVLPITTSPQTVKNLSYIIDGTTYTLIDGKNAAGTVQLFGEPVYGDLNGDGDSTDAAVLLTYNPGGSGTFYYATLALKTNGEYRVTNTLLLGNRIAPQTVEIHEGRAVFNYAERKATDPMTTPPSLGKSLWIHYDTKTGEIGELAQGFEGEANPLMMNLTMKKWNWVKTSMNNDTTLIPKKENVFTLLFSQDGKVAIGTDCNRVSGIYTDKSPKLTFSNLIMTKMFCEGSDEDAFVKALENITSYHFTSKGELILEIAMDSGIMVFK